MNKTFKTIIAAKDRVKFNLLALPDTKAFKIEVVFDYGSNLEDLFYKKYGKKVYGISHLTEHLSFKSPEGYGSDEILALLKKRGNRNASTGYTHINYYFNSIMEHMDFGIDAITKIAYNDFSRITDEEFESEKAVVMSEVGRYNDDSQTMFNLSVKSVLKGTDKDDNILGTVDILKDITLEDCKKIKALALQEALVWFNITYDPMEGVSEDDVLNSIESVLYNLDTVWQEVEIGKKEYDKTISIKKGDLTLENKSDRAIIDLTFETDTNIYVRSLMNKYVGSLANETSLYNLIRDKHGLTYGVSFGKDDMNNVDYTRLIVDVEPDKVDFTMELIEDAIVKCNEKFSREIFEELFENRRLNITMDRSDPKSYGFLFVIQVDNPKMLDRSIDILEDDLSKIDKVLDDEFITFEIAKQYMNDLAEIVKNKSYTKVTSTK